MKQDDKWLEALRENLDGYRIRPSDGLWQRIEDDLRTSPRKTARIVPLWMKAVAAAAIALVGGGGWMYFSRSLEDENAMVVADNTVAGKTLRTEKADAGKIPVAQAGIRSEERANPKSRPLLALNRNRTVSYTKEGSDGLESTAVKMLSAGTAASSAAADVSMPGEDRLIAEKTTVINDTVTADAPMLAARAAEMENDKTRDGVASSGRNDGERTDEKPRNWYDVVPEATRASMAQVTSGDGRGRWSVALTAMNGLPSVGGNTGSPGVLLSSMSNATAGLRPFGSSLADEYVSAPRPSLLAKVPPKAETTTSVKHKVPVSYGASFRYNVTGRWGLETGLSYTLLNSTFSNEADHTSFDQSLRYLELPLRASYTILNNRWIAVYAAAGGAVAKCVSASVDGGDKNDYTVNEKPWQFSVGTSAGVQLNLIEHFGIYIEPGVGYYFKDNSDIRTVYKDHPWSFRLNMGIRVSY